VKRWLSLLLVLVSLALVIGWPRNEATEEQRAEKREEKRLEERAKMWKEDFKACDKFASRRKDARRLLAYDPETESKKTLQEQLDESRRAIENLTKNLEETTRLWEADRRACLRGEGWKDEWIDELEANDREQAGSKATTRKKGLPY
jgi:hypothetical protein